MQVLPDALLITTDSMHPLGDISRGHITDFHNYANNSQVTACQQLVNVWPTTF